MMFRASSSLTAIFFALFLILATAGAACNAHNTSALPPEAARRELQRRGIRFDEESFRNNAKDGNTDIVNLFLAAGMNPDAADEKHRTALMYAAAGDYADTVRALLLKGANLGTRDWNGDTALAQASWACSPAAMRVLIEAGADVNAKSDHGYTPLLSTALDGHYECARILLESGADINVQDESGNTALMLLARYAKDSNQDVQDRILSSATGIDRMRTASLFLEKGMDLKVKNKKGETALMIAQAQGNLQMADLLKRAGAAE